MQTFQEGKESKEEESFLPKDTLEVSMGEDQGISMNLLGEESSPGPENSQKISANAWESTRQYIVAMPKDQLCTCCCKVLATLEMYY